MRSDPILLCIIGRPHGVRGLVRLINHADPPAAVGAYGPLFDERGRRFTVRCKGGDLAEIVELVDGVERRISSRTEAERLANTRLFVAREQLKPAEADEFYLADLIGAAAFDPSGARLGDVIAVHDYGGGISIELSCGLLVPFTRAAVPVVDVAAARVVVDPPTIVDAPVRLAAAPSGRDGAPGDGLERRQ